MGNSQSETCKTEMYPIDEEIHVSGGTAEFKAVDVSDREDVKACIGFAKDKFGRVDVIFNNAGVMPLSPMNALKVEEWDNMINVNIHGVLNGIAAGLPIMEAQSYFSALMLPAISRDNLWSLMVNSQQPDPE